MTIKVNFGCGMTPTDGWVNYDNSFAIKLANSSFLYLIAKSLRLLTLEQIENVEWNKKHKINFADATKKIPLEANSVECIYTSHMLEHLSCDGASAFLIEALRILKKGGVLRIAVPDLRIVVNNYSTVGDANKFMEQMFVQAPPIRNLKESLDLNINSFSNTIFYKCVKMCKIMGFFS